MEHLVYILASRKFETLKFKLSPKIQTCRNETSTSISFLQKCLTPQIYPNDVVKITSLYIRHLLTCPFQKIWRCLNKISRLQFFLKSWHPLIGKFSGRWSYFTDLKSKGRVLGEPLDYHQLPSPHHSFPQWILIFLFYICHIIPKNCIKYFQPFPESAQKISSGAPGSETGGAKPPRHVAPTGHSSHIDNLGHRN